MGRRSLHTADELRELIVQASTDLIHENGFAGLSAREIARRIDYSPGTLYNSFDNLDDLVLTIEGRMLDRLGDALDAVSRDGSAEDRVCRMADCYLGFANENPRLWKLLFEHHVSAPHAVPDWYRQKIQALGDRFEDALLPFADGLSVDEVRRAGRVLWSSVHGIASLVVAEKLSVVPVDDAVRLVRDLVETYLAGLKRREAARA